MKQKLGLSCALIHRPSLLLLDEPTFGVDPISRRDLWLIIHEMVDEGVTVVVSTSYMDEAERFDRLAFLQAGKSLSVDTPDGLRKGLAGRLLSVRVGNRSRAARDVLRTTPLVASASLFGDRLHVMLEDTTTGPGLVRNRSRVGGIFRRGRGVHRRSVAGGRVYRPGQGQWRRRP